MRLILILGLIFVVHQVQCQSTTDNEKKDLIEVSTQEEDPFTENDREDSPFSFNENEGFGNNKRKPTVASSSVKPVNVDSTPHPQPEPEPQPQPEPASRNMKHEHGDQHKHDSTMQAMMTSASPEPEPEPTSTAKPASHKKHVHRGVSRAKETVPDPEPEPEPKPEPEPEPTAQDKPKAESGFAADPQPEPTPEPQLPPKNEPEPSVGGDSEHEHMHHHLHMHNHQNEPHPEPEPSPEPEPEPAPLNLKAPIQQAPTPLPEPAIKFDNVQDEDYGDHDNENAKPDQVDNEVIEQLVNKFLNTGSVVENVTGPVFANPEAQKLIGSSDYWKEDGLKPPKSIKDPKEAFTWLDGYYREAQKVLYQVTTAGWHYFTAISPNSRKALSEAQDVMARFVRSTSMQAKQFDVAAMPPEMQKQLNYVSFEGMSALGTEDHQAFTNAQDLINQQISENVICENGAKPPCTLKKVDIGAIFNSDKDAEHLKYLWTAYVTNVAQLKPHYKKLLDLTNAAARLNGFADGGAMWRSAYDLSSKSSKPKLDLKAEAKKINEKMLPFYKQLHAYMRRQVSGIYKNPMGLTKDQAIPAHLFASTEGGDWGFHYDATKPNDEEDELAQEINSAMQAQNYTPKAMFTKAYRYFKSVGFPPLPKTFWTNSVFQRVWSKDMLCQPPAAFDMRDGVDFRVKVCAQLGEPDFRLAHNLLAQVYYQFLYKNQPLAFRESASPSINEAIANVFAHLASHSNYLYSQKLVSAEQLQIKESTLINRLFKEALDNVPKMAFALSADTWRYEILEGLTPDDKWNERWWKLREQYEGVGSPENPFNAANVDAFMHTQVNQIHSPATRNLISYVAQFQILKALCPPETVLAEGCILSEDTTMKLREMMSKGSSIDWLAALEMITGKAELDAAPLLEYYNPLITWLQNANEINQVVVGWDGEGVRFSPEEIPEMQSDGKISSGILSQDRVAFPGGDCSNGEDCLLDSHCDGKVCVCNEGTFTLKFDNTISCVASNPAESGFVGGDGKVLGVQLVPSETTTMAPTTATTPAKTTAVKSASTTALALPLAALLLVQLL